MASCICGGSQPTQSTVNTLDPDIKTRLLGTLDKGINSGDLPYQAYGGPRIAGFTDDQERGFDQVRNASDWSQGTIQNGIDAANRAAKYTPQQISGVGYNPTNATAASMNGVTGDATMYDRSSFSPVSADRVGTSTLPQAGLGGYMNPYIQGVIDPAMAEIDRQSAITQQGNKGAAALAGAFGGDRAAIVDTETQRNAQALKNQTIAGLYNTGYNTASGLAETDLGRALQAAQSNQGANLQAGLTNSNLGYQVGAANQNAANTYGLTNIANLQQAGLVNAQNQQQTSLANASAANQAAQLKAQQDYAAAAANQSAGLSAAQLGLQSASQLGSLGSLQQQTQLTGANALLGIGAQQQGLNQQNLSTGYSDFLEQRGYPMQTAQQVAGITGGYPSGSGTSTSTLPNPSLTGQVAGLGTAGLGLYGIGHAFGLFKDGGRVDGYASGGTVGGPDNRMMLDGESDYIDEFDPILGGPPVYDSPIGPEPGYGPGPVPSVYLPMPPLAGLAPPTGYNVGGMQEGTDPMALPAPDASLADPSLPDVPEAMPPTPGMKPAPPPMATRPPQAGLAPMGYNVGGMGTGARPTVLPPMAGPGLRDVSPSHVSSVLKAGLGASGNSGDIPEWAIPMAMAGFSMMASRSPRALEAIGGGGIAALQSYAQQRQIRAAQQLKAAQLASAEEYRKGTLEARRQAIEMNERTRADRTREMEQASADRLTASREAAASRAQSAADNLELRRDLATSREGHAKTPEDHEADRQARIDETARKYEHQYWARQPVDAATLKPVTTPEKIREAEDFVARNVPGSTPAKAIKALRHDEEMRTARAAIAAGADRGTVEQTMRERGFDPNGL